ncbi:MAG TPA: carbohydrate ABC transporter permease [Clostridiales bacterium]|nr:carbohydrate ABC transporter permease [Clostridiales bacterium]
MAVVKSGVRIKVSKFRVRLSFGSILLNIFMILLAAFTAIPLVYMISTAFKPLDELFIYPPRYFVRRPTLSNFTDLLISLGSSVVPFSRYIFNSLFTATVTVAGTVVVSGMGAYALSKHKLPGAGFIFSVIIAALMFSSHVTQIPSYIVVDKLGLLNSYWALIIPKLAVAYNFFLMKQFLDQFPNELLEASRIDGAKEHTIFWKIVMPSLRPAWSTLVVFSFVANWNDYFSPLVFISSQAMKTLPLALQTIGAAGNIARAGAMNAATLLMTLPTLIIFLVMQAMVMETMAHSGIKA